MIDIQEINLPDEKQAICDSVLRALPDWFGIEAALVDYTIQVRAMPFYAAIVNASPVGFAAVKIHNRFTSEVCVMGILPDHHRLGIGRLLIERCERYCAANQMRFLTVKTLAESADSEHYARTRRFYEAMGFVPLEVFPNLWDAANPCLFLAKPIQCG